MARYAFGPLMRRVAGPVLAVLALLAPLVTGSAASAAAAPAGAAGSAGSTRASSLEQAFAAARHLPSSAIGGVRAGSLHEGRPRHQLGPGQLRALGVGREAGVRRWVR